MTIRKRKPLITITGPSGSGKTEMVQILQKTNFFEKLVSTTTRPPRPNEEHGTDYFFVDERQFELGTEGASPNGKFIQTVNFKGHWYGTEMSELERVSLAGRIPVSIVEPSGVYQYELALKDTDWAVCPVFVTAELSTLIGRYVERMTGILLDREQANYHAKRLTSIVDEHKFWMLQVATDSHYWDYYLTNNKSMEEFEKEIQKMIVSLFKSMENKEKWL